MPPKKKVKLTNLALKDASAAQRRDQADRNLTNRLAGLPSERQKRAEKRNQIRKYMKISQLAKSSATMEEAKVTQNNEQKVFVESSVSQSSILAGVHDELVARESNLRSISPYGGDGSVASTGLVSTLQTVYEDRHEVEVMRLPKPKPPEILRGLRRTSLHGENGSESSDVSSSRASSPLQLCGDDDDVPCMSSPEPDSQQDDSGSMTSVSSRGSSVIVLSSQASSDDGNRASGQAVINTTSHARIENPVRQRKKSCGVKITRTGMTRLGAPVPTPCLEQNCLTCPEFWPGSYHRRYHKYNNSIKMSSNCPCQACLWHCHSPHYTTGKDLSTSR
ncbi:hypothetical protein BT63DRAFT_172306 [Microthyrium microscopicum]|uniref:Uncharacterized protein n=1 Tax=Microthyrium microscopicum TaxID=703497 RepID=A0A6A6UR76_9PEZI|nr:hypothetical protein BT63DRAFT_172306 [Microthyrium microscopicum]